MDRNSIDQAAAQAGIMADYVNAHGQQQAITPESKRALLAAMNSKAASADAAPLPPVKVFFQRQPPDAVQHRPGAGSVCDRHRRRRW
ncbi:hypothetical protein JK228_23180, partial [Serratia rubidaea]|nr:hypothetical protein [Serratia rubidaea]